MRGSYFHFDALSEMHFTPVWFLWTLSSCSTKPTAVMRNLNALYDSCDHEDFHSNKKINHKSCFAVEKKERRIDIKVNTITATTVARQESECEMARQDRKIDQKLHCKRMDELERSSWLLFIANC